MPATGFPSARAVPRAPGGVGHCLIRVVRAGVARLAAQIPPDMKAPRRGVCSRGARTDYNEIYSSTLRWSQERNVNLQRIFCGIPGFGRGAKIPAMARNKFQNGARARFSGHFGRAARRTFFRSEMANGRHRPAGEQANTGVSITWAIFVHWRRGPPLEGSRARDSHIPKGRDGRARPGHHEHEFRIGGDCARHAQASPHTVAARAASISTRCRSPQGKGRTNIRQRFPTSALPGRRSGP